MTRALEIDLVCTPERLFGETAIFTLPAREPARQVAQLVNRAITLNGDPAAHREFRWRLATASREIQKLPQATSERALLQRIVRAASAEHEPEFGLWEPLVEYVAHLEKDARLADALEVLALAARARGRELPPPVFAKCALDAARLNRRLARWERAEACYRAAHEVGLVLDDPVLLLRGQLGCGTILGARGEMAAAETNARSVLLRAERLGLNDVQMMAAMDLSVVLTRQERFLEAAAVDRRVVRLASTDEDRARALCNAAIALADVGAYRESHAAFQVVIETAPSALDRMNAIIELMSVDAALGDQFGFERGRREIADMSDRFPPTMAVDFWYKTGAGYHRFGRFALARQAMQCASEIASANGLLYWHLRITRGLQRLA